MTKEQFKKILTELIDLMEATEKVSEAFEKLDPNFNFLSLGRYESLVVKTLELAVGDKGYWISYWLYDYPKQGKVESNIILKNGETFKLKTIDDLYHLIMIDYD